MFKSIIVFMLMASYLYAARMATEGFVSNRVAAAVAPLATTGSLAAVSAAVVDVAADVSILQTNRTDKLWTTATTYMDGDGIFNEINAAGWYLVTDGVSSGGTSFPDGTIAISGLGYPLDSNFTTNIGNWIFTVSPEPGVSSQRVVTFILPTEYQSGDFYGAGFKVIRISPSLNPITLSPVSPPDDQGTVQLIYNSAATNAIDRTVTTNGTIILIGQLADTSGSTTQLTATAGSSTVTMPFIGKDYVDSSIAAIPLVPTNAITGWLVYDTGSNIWLQVTSSNFSFTVNEVLP